MAKKKAPRVRAAPVAQSPVTIVVTFAKTR